MNLQSSFYREQVVEIPPNSIYEDTFNQLDCPNYFYVNNLSAVKLYAGITILPTTEVYEMFIPANGQKIHGRGSGSSKFYVLNSSSSVTVRCIITAFSKPFDPSVLAGTSSAEVDLTGMPTVDEISIKGFTASLPSGSNKIGKIDVDNLINYTSVINSIESKIISVGGNVEGIAGSVENIKLDTNTSKNMLTALNSNVVTLKSDVGDINTDVNTILNVVDNIKGFACLIKDYTAKFDSIIALNTKKKICAFSGEHTGNGTVTLQPTGSPFRKLNFFSNDSTANMTVRFKVGATYLRDITVKPNEVLNDLDIGDFYDVSSIEVVGAGSWRIYCTGEAIS